MKVLSIIGIPLSLMGIMQSFGSLQMSFAIGVVSLIINLFFLAFSIVSTVVAFKKKKAE